MNAFESDRMNKHLDPFRDRYQPQLMEEHVLRLSIIPFHQSRLRLPLWKLCLLDLWASLRGWPKDWRCSEARRTRSRISVFSSRPNNGDLWVFGYGSLMWDPGIVFEEVRHATIRGYSRNLCQETRSGRGSSDNPALLIALKEGSGFCSGLAFRIPERYIARESAILWRREMIKCSYLPTWLQIETPQGIVDGLAFVMNQAHEEFRDVIPTSEACLQISKARGPAGTNRDYIEKLAKQLTRLGIHDETVIELANGLSNVYTD